MIAAVALAAAAPTAGAQTEVEATGNFLGGLGYEPRAVTVPVGGAVRWTNSDFLVPHTVTELHRLFDLAGSYGLPVVSPSGFGPGESVQRTFEASTFSYYCRVHGFEAQHGTVAVPVQLATGSRTVERRVRVRSGSRLVRRTVRRRVSDITARWAAEPPVAGQAFDVEYRRGGGEWRPLRTGTTDTAATFPADRSGTVTAVRARLRRADDAAIAAGWSPVASVTAP